MLQRLKDAFSSVQTFASSVPVGVLFGATFILGYATGSVMTPRGRVAEVATSVTCQRIPSPKKGNPPVEESSPTEVSSSVSELTPWYMKPEEVILPTSKGTLGSGPNGPNPPGT